MIHTEWYSHNEKKIRRVDIYLPAEYDTCSQPLPVFYLLHGINGYEGAWQERGSAIDTLQTLISEGRCKPMILVMPDCNKWPVKKRPLTHGTKLRCVLGYPSLSHEHKIEYALSDLIDMIDTMYNVSPYSVVAGLSDGARMAANIANTRQERIREVGLFSPVLHKEQLPKDTTQICSIYVGSKDFFYPNGNRFHKRMKKKGYPHKWIVLRGNHDWPVWRQCLSHFLENLSINEDPSQSADDPKSRSYTENLNMSF